MLDNIKLAYEFKLKLFKKVYNKKTDFNYKIYNKYKQIILIFSLYY